MKAVSPRLGKTISASTPSSAMSLTRYSTSRLPRRSGRPNGSPSGPSLSTSRWIGVLLSTLSPASEKMNSSRFSERRPKRRSDGGRPSLNRSEGSTKWPSALNTKVMALSKYDRGSRHAACNVTLLLWPSRHSENALLQYNPHTQNRWVRPPPLRAVGLPVRGGLVFGRIAALQQELI